MKDGTQRREIKFRAWENNKMYTDLAYVSMSGKAMSKVPDTPLIKPILMQFTGFKDKNGRDVYEGDIFRIEENDEENTIIYIVVVWVQEWAMFTTLRIEDEYQAYLMEGVDGIDETMFWTYTLEDINSSKHYPCGNIYENPELLKQ